VVKNETVDVSLLTSMREIVSISDNFEVIVWAQPLHFKFCTIIDVFMGLHLKVQSIITPTPVE
jgi:hypothetical protein